MKTHELTPVRLRMIQFMSIEAAFQSFLVASDNTLDDLVWLGTQSETSIQVVPFNRIVAATWALRVPFSQSRRHANYDHPLPCPNCRCWLRNQDILLMHIRFPEICQEVAKSLEVIEAKTKKVPNYVMQHYSSVSLEMMANFLPLEDVATLDQMVQLAIYPFPLHRAPLMCTHCHCLFLGVTCLVEHLEIVHTPDAKPSNLQCLPPATMKKFNKYGRYVAMSALETRWTPCIPGLDIKIPILSGQCKCWKLGMLRNTPDSCRTKKATSALFRWIALTSCLILKQAGRHWFLALAGKWIQNGQFSIRAMDITTKLPILEAISSCLYGNLNAFARGAQTNIATALIDSADMHHTQKLKATGKWRTDRISFFSTEI